MRRFACGRRVSRMRTPGPFKESSRLWNCTAGVTTPKIWVLRSFSGAKRPPTATPATTGPRASTVGANEIEDNDRYPYEEERTDSRAFVLPWVSRTPGARNIGLPDVRDHFHHACSAVAPKAHRGRRQGEERGLSTGDWTAPAQARRCRGGRRPRRTAPRRTGPPPHRAASSGGESGGEGARGGRRSPRRAEPRRGRPSERRPPGRACRPPDGCCARRARSSTADRSARR